jgi:hypothetical protein
VIPVETLILPQAITVVDVNIPTSTIAVLLNYEDLTFATV